MLQKSSCKNVFLDMLSSVRTKKQPIKKSCKPTGCNLKADACFIRFILHTSSLACSAAFLSKEKKNIFWGGSFL